MQVIQHTGQVCSRDRYRKEETPRQNGGTREENIQPEEEKRKSSRIRRTDSQV